MTYSPLTTLVIITALVVPLAYADDSLAIVTAESSTVTSLTRKEVADLFLGKHKINIGGQAVTPIDVTDEAPRDMFYQQVADMSAQRVNAYWARLVFSGQGRPPQQLSLTEAMALIKSQPGTVTYLPAQHANGFKILLKLP